MKRGWFPVQYSSTNLDALRSLAVAFVVASHLLLDNSVVGLGVYHVQTLGTLGVLIFFVHTCLVLMLSLERQAAQYRETPAALPFLAGRAFRIYPLSIVVVLVVSSIERLHEEQPTVLTILSNLLLIQNLTGSASVTPVLWSLPFEFQMYLFLPALYLLIRHSGRLSWHCVLALWCGCVLLVYLFWRIGLSVELIKFFPCFLPGVLAFCRWRAPRRLSPALLFAYVGLAAVLYPSLVGHGASATVLSWPICLLLGMIIPRCREIRSDWVRLSGSVIARYSYGIYLVHVPILYFSFHYLKGMPSFASWTIFIGGVGALSYLAYHCIEKPGIEFGRALVQRLNGYGDRTQRQRGRLHF